MKLLHFFIFLFSIQMMASDFEKAEKLFNQQKYSQAESLFEKYLEAYPNHTKTIEYLGDIAGHAKDWDKAIEYYEKLKNQFPKNANYHYKFGGAMGMKAKDANKFKALGMIDAIETAFLTSSKLDPKHIDARWALVELYLQLPGIVGGSEKKATKYAEELHQLSPVDGYLAKGKIAEYFKRFTVAEQHYKKAHEIGNSKTSFQNLYDLYLKKLKEPKKAEDLKKQFENRLKV
ncbi:tetratricopeptide (TPR) repeat protein [Flavobacterium arsenatis]|uniref:Tetratricopeptide (TPR) repeat protein n=1 Tax=Flavobacterium arsenatis TaxID=1484332 RepID=A0ABU1TR26_9FLAO|nr:tetratricopeptide repeat protein [Flavobacterium arsenatis]MDR6967853.1 tetratricopeptide (TPR) repeat protein [Flavobacterium arsenatis]